MAKQKRENMSQKTLDELKAKVAHLRAEILDNKLKHAKHTLKDTASLARARKQIAQALTALRMKATQSKKDDKKEVVKNG